MKKIPDATVEEYFRLKTVFDDAEKDFKEIQDEMRTLIRKGYKSKLIVVSPVERRVIPWQKIVQELVAKYMAETAGKVFYKQLNRRFKPEPIAPRIQAAYQAQRKE
jgi:hypothetical protein